MTEHFRPELFDDSDYVIKFVRDLYIVLLYLESRRWRYGSIIFACFYLYIIVVIFINYSDIDKMMDINNEKYWNTIFVTQPEISGWQSRNECT
jgi:hypothetical protein